MDQDLIMMENRVMLASGNMKKSLIFLLLFITTVSFSQNDSIKMYKEIFRDTNNIFNRKKTEAFNYLLEQIKKEGKITKRKLKRTFGKEGIYEIEKGEQIFDYTLSCQKFKLPNGEVTYSGCVYYQFIFRGRKLNLEHSAIIG